MIRFFFSAITVLIAAALAVTIFYFEGDLRLWFTCGEALALILMVLLYRSIVKPVVAAQRGLELLSAQDYNNRLAKVGEPGADKIVTLFNNLITRLKNERLRVHEQDKFLNLLIEASPMGIIVLNLNGRITLANSAFLKISELKTEDIIDKSLSQLPNTLADTLDKLAVGKSEIIRYNGIGLFRCYHLCFIQEGFRRHFYLVESLTEEVRKAEKDAYEKVIRMISHEVNNTMGSVQSVLETLAEESEDDSRLYATIGSCIERTETMCSFINSFAELARIPEPSGKLVDLDEELSRMLPFLKLMTPENITLAFNNDAATDSGNHGAKTINADMTMIQQAVINIVKNAIESIAEEIQHRQSDPDTIPDADPYTGVISIKTSSIKNGVILEIENNGIPISTEVANNLFNTFFSTKRSGRGLGLTLISEILRKHSCHFTLRTDPDNLTRFTICFPRI